MFRVQPTPDAYIFAAIKGVSKKAKKSVKEVYDLIIPHLDEFDDEVVDSMKVELDKKNCMRFTPTNSLLESFVKRVMHRKGELDVKSLLEPRSVPSLDIHGEKETILVDFSSPNIAKDMHVGHLRSTIIGDTICKFFESLDHNVHRINHIGDFGRPFGMIIQYIFDMFDGDPVGKNWSENLKISNLQEFYANAKKVDDSDEEFAKKANIRTAELQEGKPEILEMWKKIKSVSRDAYEWIYKELDIELKEMGESFYREMIPAMVKELEELGLIEDSEGRKIIKIKGQKLPLTIVKSDGAYTYDTTDLAALWYRLGVVKADRVYYVVDTGQSTHFKLVFEVARMAGWLTTQKVEHIDFGLVLGRNGKRIKSRDGGTLKLKDLLDESVIQAKGAMSKKNPDKEFTLEETKALAYGAVKYADLSVTRTADYTFSFERMLAFEGDTIVYLLYVYTNLQGIINNTVPHLQDIGTHIENFTINNEHQYGLCKLIIGFVDMMRSTEEKLMFHTMCNYMYRMCKAFRSCYKQCRCLDYESDKKTVKNVDYNTFIVFCAMEKILTYCLSVINVKVLDRM